jgi:hypothetical protein
MSEWNGTGLPPVGTRCAHQLYPHKGVIVAHVTDDGTTSAIIQYTDEWHFDHEGFVPIRSVGDLAAEDVITDMAWIAAKALYEAGYRKTE